MALFLAFPAKAETSEVRIGLQYGFIYLPLEVAGAEKLIEKQVKELSAGDIKVTLQRFSGTPEMNEVLIDWGALGLPGLLIVWEKTLGR